MNSQKREEWVTKGEEKSANNVELEPTKDNIQQAVKKVEGNNSQSSPTKGLTPQGSNTKSDDHKQGREPTRTDDKCTSEKIPQTKPTNTPKLEGCISSSTNGCGTHEPLNKKGYSPTSSETHPTEAQKSRLSNSAISRNQEGKLTGYQFYKANLKENIAKFESDPDQYRPEPIYESCVPKTNGVNDYEKEPKDNSAHLQRGHSKRTSRKKATFLDPPSPCVRVFPFTNVLRVTDSSDPPSPLTPKVLLECPQTPKSSDGARSISKGIFIEKPEFPFPSSEESNIESSIQQRNKEHSFKKEYSQEARSHSGYLNHKEIPDATSENAQTYDNSAVKSGKETDDRLDNRRDCMDNFRNSQISRHNSNAGTKTQVEETLSSSELTVSAETRPQPQLPLPKSNKKGHDNNKQNNVLGQKRDQNHRSSKIPERIAYEPRQNAEPHSLPVDDVGISHIREQNSESDADIKTKVDETESSSGSIVPETGPQPALRTKPVKLNMDHDGNQPKRQENNVSGHKLDQNTRQFELQTMSLPETIGIRGFNNSSYMDSSLVSIFLYDTNNTFSKFIQQESRTTRNDKHSVKEKIKTDFNNLIELLINDATESTVCDSAKNKFRKSLSKIDAGYLRDEKDAEEFMLTLFGTVLECSPFYRIAGEDSGDYIFQTCSPPGTIYVGNFLSMPSVQQLLNHSINHYKIQLDSVPNPGFIIKLPVTNGRQIFRNVFPNLVISLENCVVEKPTGILQMLLSAVICLRANHHTAFVRIDQDDINSSWAYLDSFQHSEYTLISNLSELLQDQSQKYNEKDELLKLLFEKPYICFYSPAK